MLVLPATVTLADARDGLAMLMPALAREPDGKVLIDASGLQRFDSSALSVLLECRRAAQASGRRFAVRGATGRLQQLARLYGVQALFDAEAPLGAAGQPGSA